MTGSPGELPLVARAREYAGRTALLDAAGPHRYGDLLSSSERVAAALLGGAPDLAEARVACLVPSGFAFAAAAWGVWRAGGVVVPLALNHPPSEWEYVLRDAGARAAVAAGPFLDAFRPAAEAAGVPVLSVEEALAHAPPPALPPVPADRRALMIYTSGTTGRPKGVVTTHANLAAQVTSLVEAWGWSPDDRILLVLPLHHVHGLVNVLTCALWSGAACDVQAPFDPAAVWERWAGGEVTLFMAVPTIYHRLLQTWEGAPAETRRRWSRGAAALRLMVSGSAALPLATRERWREVTGHDLLERYGMTETGMILSQPLRGDRRPGTVGEPLPGVEVRLVDEEGRPASDGTPGEVEVRGPGVFREYWNRPAETRAAFRQGWFRTGDVAVREAGAYRLLGRRSVDIIKTGGYKVSALEIEEVLRGHPAIADCAVLGLPDAEWGERVAVVAELRAGNDLALSDLVAWARERLAPYKLPRALRAVPALPRNALGKVAKPDLARLFGPVPDP